MRIIIILAIILFFNYSLAMSTIALGSCNWEHSPQPMWSVLSERNPDLFIWLGDNVYGDTEDMSVLEGRYTQQKSIHDYKLFSENRPIIGVWDDHDYGADNSGAEYPKKEESQQLFLDFFNVPQDSPRRVQKGIYTSYTYDIENKKIKFILLDVRYFRGDPNKINSDILGEEQWAWLKNELDDDVDLNFIVSSYSILSPPLPGAEEWADLPRAKTKLFRLIESSENTDKVVFVTGDRHFSAVLTKRYRGIVYNELMASGLTHFITEIFRQTAMRVIYGINNVYFGKNAGLLEFYPSEKNVEFSFKVINEHNEDVFTKNFKY